MYATLKPGSHQWQSHPGTPDLDALQAHVGGTVDVWRTPAGIDLWVHDEGLIRELPIALSLWRDGARVGALAGPVVAARTDARGETRGLSEDDLALLNRVTGPAVDVLRYRESGRMFIAPILDLNGLVEGC